MLEIGFVLQVAIVIIIVVVAAIVLLLAFTTGFKKTGRIMGGLFAIIGKPGSGKTYIATKFILDAMRQGRNVFSNFPVVSVDGKYVSKVWKPEYMTLEERFSYTDPRTGRTVTEVYIGKNLTRAVIVVDEALRDFWSRDFAGFTKDDALWFSTCAQHEISFYYITQHENRIDTIINDCANLFIVVEKLELPVLNVPLYFDLTYWNDETEMKNSPFHPELEPFDTERYWFSKDVAGAYDTHWFAHDHRPLFDGETWIDHYLKQGIEYEYPTDISLKRIILRKVNIAYNEVRKCVTMFLAPYKNRIDKLKLYLRIVYSNLHYRLNHLRYLLWVLWVFSPIRKNLLKISILQKMDQKEIDLKTVYQNLVVGLIIRLIRRIKK